MTEQPAKRIGMVVHAYYLRDARVIRYAEALAQAGHTVDVVCLQDPNEPPYAEVNGVGIHRVRFERRRGGKLWYIWEYVWAFILFTIQLTRLEFRQHYDIIHIHNMPDFLVFAGFIPKIRGARVVLDLHDPMPELFISKYNLERGMLIRILELQERISLWFADDLITVDQSFKDIFIRRGIRGDKISLVRNMPDERFHKAGANRPTPPTDRFTIIYAGTIAERYLLDNVIRAVGIAYQSVPNLHLQLVGKLDKEGDYTDTLNRLVDELKLQDVVEFHPPVPLDTIPGMLQKAHVCIEPSRHDPYTDYVLPLKLLESVAVGLPCLVSRRPTIERYFGPDAVVYYEPEDIEGLAAAIADLAQSLERLVILASNAQRVFETYNWNTEKATYFKLLFERPVWVH